MRTDWAVTLLACLLLRSANNSLPASNFPVERSARLKISSQAELQRALRAPFAAGTVHPKGVSNCTQFLTRRGRALQSRASGPDFLEMRATLANCLVLEELNRAVPAQHSNVHDLSWDEHVLPLLPPQLAINVSEERNRAANEAAAHGRTWADFESGITARTKGVDQIVVTGDTFSEVLILWGRGDFNGDGSEDLLVQSLDTLTEGTYRNIRLFLLSRRTPDGPLSVDQSLL